MAPCDANIVVKPVIRRAPTLTPGSRENVVFNTVSRPAPNSSAAAVRLASRWLLTSSSVRGREASHCIALGHRHVS